MTFMDEPNLGSIPEAEEVVIQLTGSLYWNAFEPGYRDYWDTDPSRGGKLSEEWPKKKEKIHTSIARRVKYEALMGSVVAKDHVGVLSSETIYGNSLGSSFGYEVLSTKPEGEVRVTKKTKLTMKFP